MSNDLCAAPACDRPTTGDGFLCRTCRDTLRRDLDSVPDLLEDLEVTISRQDNVGDASSGKRTEIPLPLRIGPMEARRDLHTSLTAWARTVAIARRSRLCDTTTRGIAGYLACHLGNISDHPSAGDCADEIGFAVIRAGWAVDRPLQAVYAGPCDECSADLYAKLKDREVACQECQAVYDVEARREWLLEQAKDQLLTAAELSRALPNLLQVPLTAAMVRGYAHRGRLAQRPHHPGDPARTPRYLVGELLDVLHHVRAEQTRQAC